MDFKLYKNKMANIFGEYSLDMPRYKEVDNKKLNPLILAYVGDAYFHLFVRENLLLFENTHVHILNDIAMKFSSATYQAKAYKNIGESLTEMEKEIFKKGKNAITHKVKSATIGEYKISTGIEAVLGYLYLNEDFKRLEEIAKILFRQMTFIFEKEMGTSLEKIK